MVIAAKNMPSANGVILPVAMVLSGIRNGARLRNFQKMDKTQTFVLSVDAKVNLVILKRISI